MAIADGGLRGEVRFWGTIPNQAEAVRKLVAKLAAKHPILCFCYEAGPCGYGLYRQILALGHPCLVVAPSLIPTKPGGHIKTGRRDATMLASLFRAGELQGVWVPDADHEAMRELIRGRQTAMQEVRRSRQLVLSFLLRHDRAMPTRQHWTRAHRAWLARQSFSHPAEQIVFEELIQRMEVACARQGRHEDAIRRLLPAWSLAGVVAAIQSMRGVALLSAVTLVAEIGDFGRFTSPRQLMAWLGLVPKEHSSGRKIARGNITKAGNIRARRVLVEGAWTYRLPARMGEDITRRNEGLPGDDPGRRLEGAGSLVHPLPAPAENRQAAERHRGRNRPRDGGICLGHRPHGAARHRASIGLFRPKQESGNRERKRAKIDPRCTGVGAAAGQGNPRSDSAAPTRDFETEEGPRRTPVLR